VTTTVGVADINRAAKSVSFALKKILKSTGKERMTSAVTLVTVGVYSHAGRPACVPDTSAGLRWP
jgi:hypothetical protein